MNEDDFSKVEQAYCFAAEKHCNQKRRSGEMYINHPVEVAIILADLKMDCDVVCAALLHDTVEDTETSLADVSGLFGDTVAVSYTHLRPGTACPFCDTEGLANIIQRDGDCIWLENKFKTCLLYTSAADARYGPRPYEQP